MTVLSILATIFGTIGRLANIPQVYRIFKRKSAKDISIATYIMVLAAVIVWVLYGIEIKNFPIIIANLIATISAALVVLGWLLYGRE